jgi:hypothetical protein
VKRTRGEKLHNFRFIVASKFDDVAGLGRFREAAAHSQVLAHHCDSHLISPELFRTPEKQFEEEGAPAFGVAGARYVEALVLAH